MTLFKPNLNIQNISSVFTEMPLEDVPDKLLWLMDHINESIFGIELQLLSGVVRSNLVTPPHIRFSEYSDRIDRKLHTDVFSFYEGHLSRPFFLPLYTAVNSNFLDAVIDIANTLHLGKESMLIQWLFRKHPHWKEKAIDMYSSYLMGNEYPLTFSAGRLVQEKLIQVLNRLAAYPTEKPYIQEVEDKILDIGFRSQLSIGVESKRADDIIQRLGTALRQYDSYNAIRLEKSFNKGIGKYVEECIVAHYTYHQILSKKEIATIFGKETETPKPIAASNSTAMETQTIEIESVYSESNSVIDILPRNPSKSVTVDENITTDIAEALKRVGIIKTARIYNPTVVAGPRLTVVQFDIPKGKTLTQIINKAKDIQAALGVPSLGVEQGTVPDTVQFTVPNQDSTIVGLRELLELESFHKFRQEHPLAFIVGVDEINNPIYLSLAQLVHLLVAGTTGSGKSVFLNSLIITLLSYHSPDELHFYLIDPKEVELQQYEELPHVKQIVTAMSTAFLVLFQLVKEMEKRYSLFREAGVKNIQLYNKQAQKPIPYIVCVVDEYADLKDTNPEVEDYIARLGQKARAAGIHLVIATQRPSTNVISGRVKAVIPNAISFNLNSNNHYKTVFGHGIGNLTLLGKGDGVMKIEGYPKELQRFQSPIISPDEAMEGQVYKTLVAHYKKLYPAKEQPKNVSSFLEQDEADEKLYRLKQIIANTRETRVSVLRDLLGVKASTLQELMATLVEEGWLIKHESKAKGYELIANEDTLSEWKD